MSETTNETIPTIDHKPHKAFFRQSGWLMIAAISGRRVDVPRPFPGQAKSVDETQYAAFGTLLTLVIDVRALHAVADDLLRNKEPRRWQPERNGSSPASSGWRDGGHSYCGRWWRCSCDFSQRQIVCRLHLPDATGLLVTLPVILVYIWFPMFTGVLQGRQDFFWMGWAAIISASADLDLRHFWCCCWPLAPRA